MLTQAWGCRFGMGAMTQHGGDSSEMGNMARCGVATQHGGDGFAWEYCLCVVHLSETVALVSHGNGLLHIACSRTKRSNVVQT